MKYVEKQLVSGNLTVTVRYSGARKRVAFSVQNGVPVLLAPAGCPDSFLIQILQDHHAVLQQLLRQDALRRADAYPPPDFRIGGTFRFLGQPCTIVNGAPGGFDGRFFRTSCAAPAAVRRDVLALCRAFAGEMLRVKVAETARCHGISYTSVTINSAGRRWGSCSASGALHFPWKIVLLPEELVDYIVAHELAHRRQMNHSPAFWREVAAICPDWKERRKALREEERRLCLWDRLK